MTRPAYQHEVKADGRVGAEVLSTRVLAWSDLDVEVQLKQLR